MVPPTVQQPYSGAQATGAARASLQRALDNYKTGHINLNHEGVDLSRSDTRSFGESHASELSSIHTADIGSSLKPNLPVTPPAALHDRPMPTTQAMPVASVPPTSFGTSTAHSPPIDASHLNLSPTPLPAPVASSVAPVASPLSPDVPAVAAVTPTVAETGTPVPASTTGPGPSTGSLRDIHDDHAAPQATFGAPIAAGGKWENAEEEKKRLREEYSQAGNVSTAPKPQETAEEEKKRLEREERERNQALSSAKDTTKKDDDLPPYQDM